MPEKFYVSGTAIATYRSKIAGLTQEKLAKLLKIPRSRLAGWEIKDRVVVDKAQFETLKAVLGLPDESQTKVRQDGLPIETERYKVNKKCKQYEIVKCNYSSAFDHGMFGRTFTR